MKKIFLIGLALFAILFIFSKFFISNQPNEVKNENNIATYTPNKTILEEKTNDDGGAITISVTPVNISAETWNFKIALDTHSEELIADLIKVSALIDDDGKEYLPKSWKGDPPGGHHREGILKFNPVNPTPSVIKLKINRVGGVNERIFIWKFNP